MNRRDFLAAAAAATSLPARKRGALPKGWKWFENYGQRVFEVRSSSGLLMNACVAYAYDPRDQRLAIDGDFGAAVRRGTAKEFRFSGRDMVGKTPEQLLAQLT